MFLHGLVVCSAMALPFDSEEQRTRCERCERVDCYYEEVCDMSGGIPVTALKDVLTAWIHDAQKPEEPCVIALSENDAMTFIANLDQVKAGDDIETVKRVFGPPTYLLPRSKEADDFSKGTRMKYYLVKQTVEYVNDLVDVHVSFLFDRSGRLESTRTLGWLRIEASRKKMPQSETDRVKP